MTRCTKNQFQCANGETVAKRHRCDNDPDCKDASDEMNCDVRDCSQVQMEISETKGSPNHRLIPCPNTTACYMKEWECDGKCSCLCVKLLWSFFLVKAHSGSENLKGGDFSTFDNFTNFHF